MVIVNSRYSRCLCMFTFYLFNCLINCNKNSNIIINVLNKSIDAYTELVAVLARKAEQCTNSMHEDIYIIYIYSYCHDLW